MYTKIARLLLILLLGSLSFAITCQPVNKPPRKTLEGSCVEMVIACFNNNSCPYEGQTIELKTAADGWGCNSQFCICRCPLIK
jgi:hypothetical protein